MLLLALACAVNHEGPYNLTLSDTTSDCAVAPTAASSLELRLYRSGDTWWVEPFDDACPGDATSFACAMPAFGSSVDYADAGLDAVQSSALRYEGSWDEGGRLTTTATHTMSCAGADCDVLGTTTPERCTTTWTYAEGA